MKHPSVLLILLVPLAGCAPWSSGPERAGAGAPAGVLDPAGAPLELAFLEPYRQSYTIYLSDSAERRRVGSLEDEVRLVERSGQPVYERVQRTETPGGVRVDSVRALARSLSPLYHSSRDPRRTMEVTFEGGRVTGTLTAVGAAAIPVDDVLERPAFDSNWIDVIARTLPLERGYSTTVRTYERASGPPSKTAIRYDLRVVGREVIEVNGREAEAFVVESVRAGGSAPTRFYIDTADRELLRLVTSPAPGKRMELELD